MARKRLKQKQSADLYFQDHHHREIIYDDAYVEALYLEKMVEPQWRRYKPKNLFGHASDPDDYSSSVAYSLDLENKFCSIDKHMSDSSLVGKGLMNLNGIDVCGKYVTKNCHDFKEYPFQSGVNYNYSRPFGNSGYATSILSDRTTMRVDIARVSYREGSKTGSSSYSYISQEIEEKETGSVAHAYGIICPTSSGCLVYHTEYHPTTQKAYEQIYEATTSGFRLLLDLQKDTSTNANGRNPSIFESADYGLHENGYYMFPHTYTIRMSDGTYKKGLEIWYAPDSNPTDWHWYELYEADTAYRNSNSVYGNLMPRISYKNGYFYIYVMCNESVHNGQFMFRTELHKTSNFVNYEKIELPHILDIPAFELEDKVKYGHLTKGQFDIIRFVLSNLDMEDFTPPTYEGKSIYEMKFGFPTYTDTSADFLSSNTSISMISNGKNATKTEEFLARTFGQTVIYIDNMEFQESENNAVYYIEGGGYYFDIDNTEELNDGDYVLGERKVEND